VKPRVAGREAFLAAVDGLGELGDLDRVQVGALGRCDASSIAERSARQGV
jgi:hypothetical protein